MHCAFVVPLRVANVPRQRHELLQCDRKVKRTSPTARLGRVETQYVPTFLSPLPVLTHRTAVLIAYLAQLGVAESHSRTALRSLRMNSALNTRYASTDFEALLSAAGFKQVTSCPHLDPPDGSSIPVRVLTPSKFLPLNGDEDRVPNDFAPVHVAVLGQTFERRRGLLLRSKLRTFENAYLEPLAVPSAFVRRAFGAVLQGGSDTPGHSFPNTRARRVIPTANPRDLLHPVVTQEPAYSFVVVSYSSQRARRRNTLSVGRLREIVTQLIRRGVDPVKKIKKILNEMPPVHHIAIYRNVPWGLLPHVLPSDVQTVLPRVRDLLQVDLISLVGLGSAIVTYMRDADSPYVQLALAGTVFAYATKIGFALSSALGGYKARIAMDKLNRIVATGDAARVFLEDMVTKKRFILLACAWAEMEVNGRVAGSEIRKSIFQENALISEEEWTWAKDMVREWASVKFGDQSGEEIEEWDDLFP